jgi:hypothetical protein
MATLKQLLTEKELKLLETKTDFNRDYLQNDVDITLLNLNDLKHLGVLFPYSKIPLITTTTALTVNILTERAINKNLKIY